MGWSVGTGADEPREEWSMGAAVIPGGAWRPNHGAPRHGSGRPCCGGGPRFPCGWGLVEGAELRRAHDRDGCSGHPWWTEKAASFGGRRRAFGEFRHRMKLGRRGRARAGAPRNRGGNLGEHFDQVAVRIRIALARGPVVLDVRRAQPEELAVGMDRPLQVVVGMSDGAMMDPLEVLQAGAKHHEQPTQALDNSKNGSGVSSFQHDRRADLSARSGVCKKRLVGLPTSRSWDEVGWSWCLSLGAEGVASRGDGRTFGSGNPGILASVGRLLSKREGATLRPWRPCWYGARLVLRASRW